MAERGKIIQNQYRYPLEAFALASILFTSDALQSVLTGILLIWLLLFSYLLKNLLKPFGLGRSGDVALMIAAASVSFSLFRMTDYAVGLRGSGLTFSFDLYAVLSGLLAAHTVLDGWGGRQYHRLIVRSTVLWVMLILTGILREFLSGGSMMGVKLYSFPWQSTVFARPAFGLIITALVFALLDPAAAYHVCEIKNPIFLRKKDVLRFMPGVICPILALLILVPPDRAQGSLLFHLAGVAMILIFYRSVRRRLSYSDVPFGPLSTFLMAVGFFYLIFT